MNTKTSTITAKEVYLFADICIDIQNKNIEMFKEELKNPKHIRRQRQTLRNLIKQGEEKLDYLENTKSIVLALYQKQGKKLKVTEEDKAAIKEKYKIGEEK